MYLFFYYQMCLWCKNKHHTHAKANTYYEHTHAQHNHHLMVDWQIVNTNAFFCFDFLVIFIVTAAVWCAKYNFVIEFSSVNGFALCLFLIDKIKTDSFDLEHAVLLRLNGLWQIGQWVSSIIYFGQKKPRIILILLKNKLFILSWMMARFINSYNGNFKL